MSAGSDWGALPVLVAPLWRPPPPPGRDEDGQFSDASGSEEEDESLPAVPPVPRLALSEMVAEPRPLEPPPLSALSLQEPAAGGSPRSAAGTASVSLRSYLDPAAGDLTADLTDCETLDQLAELAETPRTVRPGPSASPCPGPSTSPGPGRSVSPDPGPSASLNPGPPRSWPATNGLPDAAPDGAEDCYLSSSCSDTTLNSGGLSPEHAADTAGVRGDTTLNSDGLSPERAADTAGVRKGVITVCGMALLRESCRGGTVTSFLPPVQGPGRDAAAGNAQTGERVRAGRVAANSTLAGGGDGYGAEASVDRSYSGDRVRDSGLSDNRTTGGIADSGGAIDRISRATTDTGYSDDRVPRAVMENGDSDKRMTRAVTDSGFSDATLLPIDSSRSQTSESVADRRRGQATIAALSTPLVSMAVPAPPALPAPLVSLVPPSPPIPPALPVPPSPPIPPSLPVPLVPIFAPARPIAPPPMVSGSPDPLLPTSLPDSGPPPSEAPEAPCPVHGSPGRRRAFRRSPARRLSFTLESPSPLLVEYYSKHPEQRLQVLENALDVSAPVVSPAAEPAAAGDRPRRRWADEAAAAAELRAALAGQDPVPGSPVSAAGPTAVTGSPVKAAGLPEVPLGWGSALHSLTAADQPGQQQQQQQRWRPPAATAPTAAPQQLSPAPAASPAGPRRRPAQTAARRPTPNFDSHAVQEIVQGRSPPGQGPRAELGWGTVTPSPPPLRGLSPAAPAVSASPISAQDALNLPALSELRRLLAQHERQAAALIEQQRRQRRQLEAACRRREDAVLLRLRRQLAAAELLAAPPADSRPDSPQLLTAQRPPLPSPSPAGDAQCLPSAYERYESQLSTPPGRDRPPRPAPDPVPTPVARRQGAPAAPAEQPVTLPQQAHDPAMQARFARVTAAARGYLTRRLMKTEKVQSLIAAAKESMACALRLQREVDLTRQVTRQDVELHERLVNQVRGACYSLHQLFIGCSAGQRLAVIAADRAARAHAAERRRSAEPTSRASLSQATLLALQRRRHRDPAAPASPRPRPRPRPRPASGAGSASPSGRPRRVVAHSPRPGSRSSLLSGGTAGGSRAARTARSLSQLASVYAPAAAAPRRPRSSQSQLGGGSSQQTGEPKRRQRTGRAWR